MGTQFYTHYALGDSFERMAPALIFGLLLFCRLIILMQVIKKEKKDAEMMKKLTEAQMANETTEEVDASTSDEVEDKKKL